MESLASMENTTEQKVEYTTDMINALITKAKKYERHLEYVASYQKNHPDKIKEKQANYYKRLKQECPDKYCDMLQKKKQYYAEKVKPNRPSKKEVVAVC